MALASKTLSLALALNTPGLDLSFGLDHVVLEPITAECNLIFLQCSEVGWTSGWAVGLLLLFFLTLGKYDPEGDEKLRKLIYKLGYDHQSVRSVVGKLSCRRTAL